MSPIAGPTSIAGKPVGPIGYGLMGLTTQGDKITYDAAVKAMKAALDSGANFWNGGTFYGPPNANSLQLLKHYFTLYPSDASRVVISIKGSFNSTTREPDCSPEAIRAAVEDALRVLDGTKTIDLYENARVDPKVPIETSIGALAQLIKEGKIGSYGLSEANATTIRRAHAVHPVAAVEVELGLFTLHALENGGIVDTCHELGIPIVAYGALGKGFLTGQLKKYEDLPEDDVRRHWPRFQPRAFEQNVLLANAVEKLAKKKGCTTSQVAIAWVKQQGALPIPGATTVERVLENCKQVELSEAELAELQKIVDEIPVAGERYPAAFQKFLNL